MICPDWKTFPKTQSLKITGVSGSPVKVIDLRTFPVSLSPDPEEEFPHPFSIVEEPDLLLLSSQAMYSKLLGISWDKSGQKPSLTWKDKKNTLRSNLLSPHSQSIIGKLTVPLHIEGNSEAIGKFNTKSKLSGKQVTVYHCPNHLENKGMARLVLVTPSLSEVSNGCSVDALVHNFSPNKIILHPSELLCLVRPVGEASILRVQDTSSLPTDQISAFFEDSSDDLLGQGVMNLPPVITKKLDQHLAQIESSCSPPIPRKKSVPDSTSPDKILLARERNPVNKEERQSDISYFDFPHTNREPTEKEKHDMLEKIYSTPHDRADFGLVPGNDIGFDINPSTNIKDDFDMSSVAVPYRPFVLKLIHDHDGLFSRSDLDCGDVSRTLGTFSLPLCKPLVHNNHRIYYLMGRKRQALKTILSLMIKEGLLHRVRSASFSSPIFLIDKKNPASLPRLLADVRNLNKHLMPIQQFVPKIQSLLEDIGQYQPSLFSNMDLASAFFSLKPDPKAQKLLTLSSQFGLFEAKIAVQGLSVIPTIFSDFIHRALHTDISGDIDPIAFLVGYLDDVITFSPKSTLGCEPHKELLKQI